MEDILSNNNKNFIERLESLKKQHQNNIVLRKNGTLLLSPNTMPKCKHMFFPPITEDLIEEFLRKPYKNQLPMEYENFLKYSNGVNLCYVKLIKKNFSHALCLFVVFGLPRTQPYGRPLDMEEPYDIRIEDLRRHKDIPQTWLKCGRYIKNYNFSNPHDIFIDTINHHVYGCENNSCKVSDAWDSLDDCFNNILESFADMKSEYVILT